MVLSKVLVVSVSAFGVGIVPQDLGLQQVFGLNLSLKSSKSLEELKADLGVVCAGAFNPVNYIGAILAWYAQVYSLNPLEHFKSHMIEQAEHAQEKWGFFTQGLENFDQQLLEDVGQYLVQSETQKGILAVKQLFKFLENPNRDQRSREFAEFWRLLTLKDPLYADNTELGEDVLGQVYVARLWLGLGVLSPRIIRIAKKFVSYYAMARLWLKDEKISQKVAEACNAISQQNLTKSRQTAEYFVNLSQEHLGKFLRECLKL